MGKKCKYWVEYKTWPYGKQSRMIATENICATSKKDAEEWKKVLEKDKDVWDIKIIGPNKKSKKKKKKHDRC